MCSLWYVQPDNIRHECRWVCIAEHHICLFLDLSQFRFSYVLGSHPHKLSIQTGFLEGPDSLADVS